MKKTQKHHKINGVRMTICNISCLLNPCDSFVCETDCTYSPVHYSSKVWGQWDFSLFFKWSLLCSPMLHLFDWKYS